MYDIRFQKLRGQIIDLIDAFISLAEDYCMDNSEIIDKLTDIFADYFDDEKEE